MPKQTLIITNYLEVLFSVFYICWLTYTTPLRSEVKTTVSLILQMKLRGAKEPIQVTSMVSELGIRKTIGLEHLSCWPVPTTQDAVWVRRSLEKSWGMRRSVQGQGGPCSGDLSLGTECSPEGAEGWVVSLASGPQICPEGLVGQWGGGRGAGRGAGEVIPAFQ